MPTMCVAKGGSAVACRFEKLKIVRILTIFECGVHIHFYDCERGGRVGGLRQNIFAAYFYNDVCELSLGRLLDRQPTSVNDHY